MSAIRRAGCVVIAIACAVVAVLLIGSIRPAAARVRSGDVAPKAATPVWSVRRVPALLQRAVESEARARAVFTLTRQLSTIVAPARACVEVDGPVGALARVGGSVTLAPASTMKLLTATAALDRLGPDHRFTTTVTADSRGDLIIVGGGDPLLATAEHVAYLHGQARFRDAPVTPLANLANAIVAAGFHSVRGALLVDDRAHDITRFLPAWKPIYTQEGDVGSLGALAVDGGFDNPNDTVASADPALTTARRLATLLAARGVHIAGGVERAGTDTDTETRTVAHVESPPLSVIVGEMLTSSDNFTAEELLRDLAVGGAGAPPATTAAGVEIVEQTIASLGVPTAGLVMRDGSGLAATDRVSCATMLELIELSAEPRFAAVDRGLPVAGRTGTLVGRFAGGPLAGKLRAKTGSIDGVVALVGVIDGVDTLHFAFLANGQFSVGGGVNLQDEVATAVGATPDLRPPVDLVPAP